MEPTTISYIWLITGVLLLLAEAFGVTGVGLLFAGLGAFTVGFLLKLGAVGTDETLLQFVCFLAATALWTVALWKPMRKFYSSKNKAGYSNMIGETAYAGSSGLKKGEVGEATWSGTIMKAQLADDAGKDHVEGGAPVEIVDVKGVTLIVKPK
ncbi:MAG: NfeD family protein [Alphaproteobacteria bacterium]|nr:NfeD family protein [Alphaproteobacteria bacterium]